MKKLASIFASVLLLLGQASLALPAKDFFQAPRTIFIEISPNGEQILLLEKTKNAEQIILLKGKTRIKILDLNDKYAEDSRVRSLSWIDNIYVAIEFSEAIEGIKDLEDTKSKDYLLVAKTPSNAAQEVEIYRVETPGWLVDPLPDIPNKILYAKSSMTSSLYELDVRKLNLENRKRSKLVRIDGGQFRKKNAVATVKNFVSRWFLDAERKPIAVLSQGTNGILTLRGANDSLEKILDSWAPNLVRERLRAGNNKKLLRPIAYSGSGEIFFCLDYNERVFRTLYKVDYEKDKRESVYQSPDHEILGTLFNRDKTKVIGVKVLANGQFQDRYFDEESDKNISKQKKPGELELVVSESLDGSSQIVYREQNDKAGRYYLKKKGEKEKHIASVFPNLDGKLTSRLVKDSVTVSGLKIPFLLELPTKVDAAVPLIVMPHGGPIGVFDSEYFDLSTQFFVAQGFAVLRVNFRGSSGYSEEHRHSGERQWGKLMIEDIYRATKKVTARDDIDSKKTYVFGISYGGYAASLLAIKHPDTYKKAVSMAAPSDLPTMINETRLNFRQRNWLRQQIGDLESELAQIQAISPAFMAHKLKIPFFIIHGEDDDVVDIEQAYRMRVMLDKYKIPYKWKSHPEMKHSIKDWELRAEVFQDIVDFLKI